MKKKILILISMVLISFNIFSFEYDGSIVVSVVPQDLCEVTSLENDFIFLENNSFRFGPEIDVGWSIARYLKDGSNALIFGYSFGLGMKAQYKIVDNLFADCNAKITAIYATFPTVLWGNGEVGLTYYFDNKIFVRGMAGILFWSDVCRFKGSAACGIRL